MWPVSKWYMGSICHIFFLMAKKKKDFLSLKAWFSEIVHCREAEVTWVLWMYKHGNLRVTAPTEVNVIWPRHLTPPFPQPEPAPTLWTLSCAHCSFQEFVLEGHLGSLCSPSLPIATQPIRRVNTNVRTFCEAKNLQGLVWESCVSHRSDSALVYRSRTVENCCIYYVLILNIILM